jgi:hypothetical protein
MSLLIGLFVAGIAQDFLNAVYIAAIAERQRMKATVLAGFTTLLSYLVFAAIIQNAAGAGLVSYALGQSLGTWISLSHARSSTG